MKLFQQMLVAGASLSLMAPIAAQASNFNIEGMNSYSRSKSSQKQQKFNSKSFTNELATIEENVDSSNVEFNNFEAGTFSDTTTLDVKTVFTLGSLESEDDFYTGDVLFSYTYQMNLNTSFNGDDNLYVRLKTGNHDSWSDTKNIYNGYLSAGTGKGDGLEVDKIWYTLPIGANQTIYIGPKIENYYMHATTPSLYKPVLKAFTLGGNASAYGASTSPGVGWAYNADNGFAISSNFTSQDGEITGMLTDESMSSWATQVGYTQPRYSVSAIVNMKSNNWEDEYFQTAAGFARENVGDGSSTNIGLRGWWRPEETGTFTPSISLGYDTSETDADGESATSAYFVGLTWQDIVTPDDRIGLAFGQPQTHEGDEVDPFLYELYYDYKVNDSITVTPAIFGGTANDGANEETQQTGYVINTTFKF